jgi:ribosomal protein S18 acetylase RimI-like enzyme
MSEPTMPFDMSSTRPDEFGAVLDMARRVAVFDEEEVDTVKELLEGYAESPEVSGYYFLSCRENGRLLGFACWGPRALSGSGYDLYWICADISARNRGVGRALLRRVEAEICACEGRWLVIETSDTDPYLPARRLYERCGYALSVHLPDFYDDGDGLCIYTRRLR